MKRLLIIVASLVFSSVAVAQHDTIEGIYNGNVVVTGSYRPVLDNMPKINVAPALTDTSTTLQHNFAYTISPKRLTSLFVPLRISAAKVVGEPTTRLYNSYLRLGMGNNWSPLLEAYYNSTRCQYMNYGAYVTHESSWGTIGRMVDSIPHSADYYGQNHWSMTHVGGFLKYILKDKVQLSTDVDYNHDYNMFYGFNDSVAWANAGVDNKDLDARDYDFAYQNLLWNIGVRNLQTDVNKLGYQADAKLSQLWGSYGQSEFNLGLSGDIHYGFPILSNYKGVVYLHTDWEAYRSTYGLTSPNPCVALGTMNVADTHVRNIVRFNPYVDMIFEAFNLHAGLNLAVDGYSDDTSAHVAIFPDVVVSKSFMNESMNLSLGFQGNLDANSWNSIRLVNPFVLPGYGDLKATSHYDLFASMRMNFNKKLRLDLMAQYSVLRDDLTFVDTVSTGLHNQFRPMFVDLSQATVGGDLSFLNDELLQASLGGHYYLYSGDNDDASYRLYRPNFDAHLNVSLNYKNKWLVKLQGLLVGPMYGATKLEGASLVLDEESRLPMRTGVNMEVEYRHNKALSFFTRFDNVLAQRYFFWNHYPSHRFQFLAGLTYTIH